MNTGDPDPLIGLVGVCASGKSTITVLLRATGMRAKPIAQEHSYVADMWQRLTQPEILVFLDASYAETIARRRLNWSEAEYLEQHRRLAHARLHANLYIFTDGLTPAEVIQEIILFRSLWLANSDIVI
jgi:dephospho-CoA kinase